MAASRGRKHLNICTVSTERDWHSVNRVEKSEWLRIVGYVAEHKTFEEKDPDIAVQLKAKLPYFTLDMQNLT